MFIIIYFLVNRHVSSMGQPAFMFTFQLAMMGFGYDKLSRMVTETLSTL